MSRKSNLVGIVVALVMVLALAACGKDKKEDKPKSYTVGIANPSSGLVKVVDGFKAGMADLGYVEGENLTYIDAGPLGADQEVWRQTLQDMIDKKVDLIVTEGTPMSIMAQQMTDTIPILFMPITDPVSAGLVTSVSSPGGNLTGIRVGGQDLPRLGWLQKVAPDVKRVYIAYNPDDPAPTSILADLRDTASGLGLELVEVETLDSAAMEDAAKNVPDDVDAIYVMPDSMAVANIPNFRESALDKKIPLASIPLAGADLGVLLTYGFDPYDVGQTSAGFGDKILKGTSPKDIPVQTAEFFLTINLETADAIGLQVSDDILRQAKEVIRPGEANQ